VGKAVRSCAISRRGNRDRFKFHNISASIWLSSRDTVPKQIVLAQCRLTTVARYSCTVLVSVGTVALCPVCRLPVLLSGWLVLLKAAPAPTSDTYCSGPRGVGAWAGDEASGTAGNIYEIEMPLIQSRPPTTRGPEQYVSLIGAGAAGAAFSNTRWVTAPLHQQRISGPTSKTANAGSVGNQAQSACQMPHSACLGLSDYRQQLQTIPPGLSAVWDDIPGIATPRLHACTTDWTIKACLQSVYVPLGRSYVASATSTNCNWKLWLVRIQAVKPTEL